jgi:hypothetical protein
VSESIAKDPLMSVDPVTLAYYAMICGCLALASPRWTKMRMRLMVGVIVGVVAALLLPVLRGAIGL